ncbi:hypothetical protein EVAR_53338_1 [Eumeta japonica]|uniref:Uncharacterized protein n=1 Tax=Eumeta variegata TaxID=151549 RepID=A0A4C1XA00_EUMVA|nr:hypothetical protein EVAR_53338_1 [Eumeta japonica]
MMSILAQSKGGELTGSGWCGPYPTNILCLRDKGNTVHNLKCSCRVGGPDQNELAAEAGSEASPRVLSAYSHLAPRPKINETTCRAEWSPRWLWLCTTVEASNARSSAHKRYLTSNSHIRNPRSLSS